MGNSSLHTFLYSSVHRLTANVLHRVSSADSRSPYAPLKLLRRHPAPSNRAIIVTGRSHRLQKTYLPQRNHDASFTAALKGSIRLHFRRLAACAVNDSSIEPFGCKTQSKSPITPSHFVC